MRRRLIRLAALPLIVVSVTAGAAELSFRAETLDVPGKSGCVQVGLFLNDTGMTNSWEMLVATLDYSADMGVLGGVPEARLSSFVSMTENGLTNPATLQPAHGGMSMCSLGTTTNSVVLGGGMAIPFMPGTGKVMFSETVNAMTMVSGRISFMGGGPIQTLHGMDQLFAILTFPVTGSAGTIHINFSMATPESNAMSDSHGMTVAAATTGGAVLVGQGYPIPTLGEWGAIVFFAGILLSTLFVLRRRSIPS
jgi:hypothetical protein